MPEPDPIGPNGGYRGLRAFEVAEIIYDGTAAFVKRAITPRSRTVDQMIQAARSVRFVKVNMLRWSANEGVHLVELRVWEAKSP
jgi:hypothetical protein